MTECNSEEYFIFLDPPYDDTFTSYSGNPFGKNEQIELSEIFKSSKSKIMLVINDTPLTRGLYGDYIILSYGKKYSMTTYSKKIDEKQHLAIVNYSIHSNPFISCS
jgi:DNA adenine methylase